MAQMTAGSFDATVLLTDLVIAQRDNQLDDVRILVDRLNKNELITPTDVNLNTLFNPHFNIINESFFYIANNLNGLMDRNSLILNAEIYQLRQHGSKQEISEYVDSLVANEEKLQLGTITLISQLIALCVQYNDMDSLVKLRSKLQEMGTN